MPRIFVSYRRSDSQMLSKTIYQKTTEKFGTEDVFIDLESLPLGEYFPAYLWTKIMFSDIILLVIGSKWEGEKDEYQSPRIMNRFDYVRREAEMALFKPRYEHTKNPVIPLIVDNVDIQKINLPKSLKH